MTPDLKIKIGSVVFKNPVMVASGTFGYAEEFADFLDFTKLGAIVSKTITLKPRQGNIPPRTCETPSGMLNSIGLENPGIEEFVGKKLPILKKFGPPIIVSIASEGDPDEFAVLATRLDQLNTVSALELNISCPNVKHAGKNLKTKLISQDPRATYEAVRSVRKSTNKTLITKLSPNVTDIVEIAQAAQDAGSDALALINTVQGMTVDVKTRRPKIAMVVGGLSGPAIRPIALRTVWEVYQKVKIPIIGMGGIIDDQSALEFFISGASAVSAGTANFIDPGVSIEILSGIKKYLIKNKIKSIRDLVGKLEKA
jgi:dihydroorotate dehydrogenase (NAD+) catalytic subunit